MVVKCEAHAQGTNRRAVVTNRPGAFVLPGACYDELGRQRRGWHNRRRDQDPLGEGQPCTWRTRLIKVAARVRQTSRRVLVELSASWPYLANFQRVGQRILRAQSLPADSG